MLCSSYLLKLKKVKSPSRRREPLCKSGPTAPQRPGHASVVWTERGGNLSSAFSWRGPPEAPRSYRIRDEHKIILRCRWGSRTCHPTVSRQSVCELHNRSDASHASGFFMRALIEVSRRNELGRERPAGPPRVSPDSSRRASSSAPEPITSLARIALETYLPVSFRLEEPDAPVTVRRAFCCAGDAEGSQIRSPKLRGDTAGNGR